MQMAMSRWPLLCGVVVGGGKEVGRCKYMRGYTVGNLWFGVDDVLAHKLDVVKIWKFLAPRLWLNHQTDLLTGDLTIAVTSSCVRTVIAWAYGSKSFLNSRRPKIAARGYCLYGTFTQ